MDSAKKNTIEKYTSPGWLRLISLLVAVASLALNNYFPVHVDLEYALAGVLFSLLLTIFSVRKEVVGAIEEVKKSSCTLDALLRLENGAGEHVVMMANKYAMAMLVAKAADDSVGEMIKEEVADVYTRFDAYSRGRINVPIEEAPSANKKLIEVFRERMDAVSVNDLNFWSEPVGRNYLEQTTEPTSRSNGSKLSRIFILKHQYLVEKRELLVDVLRYHLDKGIGFAIVVEDSLRAIKKNHHITKESDDFDDESATRLDFALFNMKSAVSFFRRETSSSRRFKAVLEIGEESENSEIIARHRRLWIDLIGGESWIISRDFLEDLKQDACTKEELKQLADGNRQDLKKLKAKIEGFAPEDEWFPLVVESCEELEEKIGKAYGWFKTYHKR